MDYKEIIRSLCILYTHVFTNELMTTINTYLDRNYGMYIEFTLMYINIHM